VAAPSKTGLRLAGGIILFCASLFLLAYGLAAVWSEGHFVSSAWIGWVELSLAAVLIPLTMHLWIQFFAGCVGFAFLKSLVVAIAGRDWFPPHMAFSRLEASEMALFFGATFLWLARFAKSRPEFADSGHSAGRTNVVSRNEKRIDLTPTGLLMEGDFSH